MLEKQALLKVEITTISKAIARQITLIDYSAFAANKNSYDILGYIARGALDNSYAPLVVLQDRQSKALRLMNVQMLTQWAKEHAPDIEQIYVK